MWIQNGYSNKMWIQKDTVTKILKNVDSMWIQNSITRTNPH